MVMSCGRFCGSLAAGKEGTGGRGGVAGGAFSLSVACDSWLDRALDVLGREGRSVVCCVGLGFELKSAGGLGKSATIWRVD